MIVAAEQTVWAEGSVKNGIYMLSDDMSKMFGFAKHGTTDFQMFKRPISIDPKGREFLTLHKEADPQPGKKVEGSKGAVYYVHDNKCTCPGFKYRGFCKHV